MEASEQSKPWSPHDAVPSGSAPAGSPTGGDEAGHDAFAERPELYVGAAFAGGLLLAAVIRVLGR